MPSLKRVGTMLVLFSLFSSLLFGYGKTWKGYDLERQINAGYKIGPFYLDAFLALNDAGYDSNVYRMPDNPVKDYSFTAGPALTLHFPIRKKVVFTVYESPQYIYFYRTRQERTWNNALTGRVQFSLNRMFLAAEAGMTVAREIWSTEIDIRPQRKATTMSGSLLWQPTTKTSFGFEAREFRFQFEDLSYLAINLPDALNHREQYLNATAYYQLSYRLRVRLEGEYGRFLFDNPANPRNSESRSLFGGLDFGTGGAFEGRVRLGYKYFAASGAGSPDFRGLVGDSSVEVKLGRAMRLRASYVRDVRFSLWPGYVYYIESRTGAGASIYLSRNIRLDYDYTRGFYDYPQGIGGDLGQALLRNDRIEDHRVGVYFRLRRNIGLGLTADWWRRDSTESWFKSDRMFAGANLTYDF